MSERARHVIRTVTLKANRFYLFKLERGIAPIHLSLDNGQVITLDWEGATWSDRFPTDVQGTIWQYEGDPYPNSVKLMELGTVAPDTP